MRMYSPQNPKRMSKDGNTNFNLDGDHLNDSINREKDDSVYSGMDILLYSSKECVGERRYQFGYRKPDRKRIGQEYCTQRMHDVLDQRAEHFIPAMRPRRHMLRLLDRDHEERQH
jgi:hypothetical protein